MKAIVDQPEVLFALWKEIIGSAPIHWEKDRRSPEVREWLGRVAALCEADDPISADTAVLRAAISALSSSMAMEIQRAVDSIWSVIYRQLAKAELKMPPSKRGAFVVAGAAFDAFAVLASVIAEAGEDLLIADPYLDGQALTKFIVAASPGVSIRLLSDSHSVKPSLKPAAEAWTAQYGTVRPLQVRLTPARALHDRTIIVDRTVAYILTQSLNGFATRSPASISKVDTEISGLKIPAYEQMWLSATPI